MDKINETRRKEKNQHIQVFVRVRPINNAERIGKSLVLVDVPSSKDVIVRERPQDKLSKKFTFDKVFGPSSKQVDVYSAVVSPLLEEVLAGYNCTVFAYGQTGTGKTFTMEGVSNDPALHWQSDTSAGIIPRSLSHLFDELRLLDAQEYTVRVSFLELYNEELFDLLSPTDDASKIRLYEDVSRKGGVIIHGLEEVTVHNKSEVYKILEKGSEKRQTAATLMNAQSSRSHTVFSITVHIKENTVDGEELLKTGKLNLVDLAGSENVGRSGAVDRRAREAGSINQSLLTLGRVITALVERAPHIPYRESKLTRLLQESLGGRTKTSIIATISPASVNLEETLSTLDYAHRAKNITNRPEINQKLSKKALLKEYTEEIERLRRDLAATRERNGVYLAQENYNEMQTTIQYQCKEIEEKINHIKALEETMQAKEKLFLDLQVEYQEQQNQLHQTKNVLETIQHVLKETEGHLKLTELERDEQKYLVEKHVSTEKTLLSQATTLLDVADVATTDTHKLHDKIIRKTKVEQENEDLSQQFRQDIARRFQGIENDLTVYTQELVQFCMSMKDQVDAQTKKYSKGIDTTIQQISKDLINKELAVTNHLTENINDSHVFYQKWLQNELQSATLMTDTECTLLDTISSKLAPRIHELVHNGIAENLRSLNNDISTKLEHLAQYTAESINLMCTYRLEERDRLCKNIHEIKESVQNVLRNQEKILCKRENFKKIFENMYKEFHELDKSESQNSLVISNMLSHVDNIFSNMNDEASNNCATNVEKERALKEQIKKDIDIIKCDASTGMANNWILAEHAMEQSNTLVQELQTDLCKGRDTLTEYKNAIEIDIQEMQQKSEENKKTILCSIQSIDKVVADASFNHVEYMESQRGKASIAAAEMGHKFGNQSMESTEWNNRITSQLRTTQHQVDKFLIEDLRRDIPTGTTPVRREFQYPRCLVQTSPHERIIQRFREIRKSVESSDDDNTTLQDIQDVTLLSNVSPNETAKSQIQRANTSPLISNTLCVTSSPQVNSCKKVDDFNSMNNLVKCASTSDISIISRPSLDASIRSDTDAYIKNGNKENGDDEFLKPGKTRVKRLSKLKNPNRRVLGTYN